LVLVNRLNFQIKIVVYLTVLNTTVILEILRINTTEGFGQMRAEQHCRSYSNIIIGIEVSYYSLIVCVSLFDTVRILEFSPV
jgi:hypothetical protein